jgi:hypothetical protein
VAHHMKREASTAPRPAAAMTTMVTSMGSVNERRTNLHSAVLDRANARNTVAMWNSSSVAAIARDFAVHYAVVAEC